MDFSGMWQLDKKNTKLGLKDLESLEDASVRIEHHDPNFRLERTFVMRGGEHRISFELTTDGKELTSQEGGRTLVSRLYWEGETLVFLTRILSVRMITLFEA